MTHTDTPYFDHKASKNTNLVWIGNIFVEIVAKNSKIGEDVIILIYLKVFSLKKSYLAAHCCVKLMAFFNRLIKTLHMSELENIKKCCCFFGTNNE